MKLSIQIFLTLVLPVILLLFLNIPNGFKGIIIILAIVSIIYLTLKEKVTLRSLGIRLDNLEQSIMPYTFFTLLAGIGLFILARMLNKQPLANWWTYSHLQWAFLPISFLQEYVYRAFFQTKLQKVLKPIYAILISTLLYSGMHVLWKDPLIIGMTFVAGLAWGYLWYKFPNLLLLTLSHAVLNFLAIYFNFFPWLITSYFLLH